MISGTIPRRWRCFARQGQTSMVNGSDSPAACAARSSDRVPPLNTPSLPVIRTEMSASVVTTVCLFLRMVRLLFTTSTRAGVTPRSRTLKISSDWPTSVPHCIIPGEPSANRLIFRSTSGISTWSIAISGSLINPSWDPSPSLHGPRIRWIWRRSYSAQTL